MKNVVVVVDDVDDIDRLLLCAQASRLAFSTDIARTEMGRVASVAAVSHRVQSASRSLSAMPISAQATDAAKPTPRGSDLQKQQGTTIQAAEC